MIGERNKRDLGFEVPMVVMPHSGTVLDKQRYVRACGRALRLPDVRQESRHSDALPASLPGRRQASRP
jgi:hypothetical protein